MQPPRSSIPRRLLRGIEDRGGCILAQRAGVAIQALGGVGYTSEFPVGRLWRDAKLYEIGAGTSEVRRMLIGRELMSETA